jgi:hypothetical protein
VDPVAGAAKAARALRPGGRLVVFWNAFQPPSDLNEVFGAFGDPEQWRFDWEWPYTRDQWLDTVPTFGGHSQIPPDKREELLAGIGAAIDAAGGSFTMGYAPDIDADAAARAGMWGGVARKP